MKRAVWATLGLGTLLVLWGGPLPRWAGHAFFAHMSLHMGVVAVAAPCLALALAGGSWDPVRIRPGWFPPVPLSLMELVWVWAWHTPGLHHWARHSHVGFVLEQSTFLLAGLLVWLSAFGGGLGARSDRAGAGIAALLLTSMHMTLLGALLALTPRPLYRSFHAHAAESVSLLRWRGHPSSPLEDQHLGGAIMLLVGGAAYLLGGLWLTVGLVQHVRRPKEATA